jgi:hypothetical protein
MQLIMFVLLICISAVPVTSMEKLGPLFAIDLDEGIFIIILTSNNMEICFMRGDEPDVLDTPDP